MPPEGWFPVFTLILGQALVIAAAWLETLWRRRQAAKDRERESLRELQDALDDLLRRCWEAHAYRQRRESVPSELSAEHRIASGRVRRLATRIGDGPLRASVDEVLAAVNELIAQHYSLGETYPYTAEGTLARLDRLAESIYERSGTIIRAWA